MMTRRNIVLLCAVVAAGVGAPAATAQSKHYEANWESIDSRPTPAWWNDA
jgi:hypothetical protein